MDEKIIKILKATFKCAALEAGGSAEHICEWVNPDKLYDALVEAGIDVSDIEEYKEYY